MKRIVTLLVGTILAISATQVQADHFYRGGNRGPNWGCNPPRHHSNFRSSYSVHRPSFVTPGYYSSFYGSQPIGVGVGFGGIGPEFGGIGGGFGNAPFPPFGAYGIGSPFYRGPGVSLFIGR